jgi:hypothetical protein
MKAKEVLRDCTLAKWELTDAIKEGGQGTIKQKWVYCLTLLRMVGHVLSKKDSESHKEKANEIKALFNRKKVDAIFKNFIEEERNLALKEYEVKIEKIEKERHCNIEIVLNNGKPIYTNEGERIGMNATEKVTIYSVKGNGFGSGKAPDELIEEAIEWRRQYLE